MVDGANSDLAGIDLAKSYLLGVIYDDESLMLEMDYHLTPEHPLYETSDSEEGYYRKGFIRFAQFDDLKLQKTHADEDKDVDLSDIYSATIEGNYANISSGWGDIELTARTIKVVVD